MVLGQPRVTSLSPFLPPNLGGRDMTQNEKQKRQNKRNETFHGFDARKF
jgi:hypothetical protein